MSRRRNPRFDESEDHDYSYRVAKDIYEMFYDKTANHDIVVPVNWPQTQSVMGIAKAIGYRSDKWEDDGHYVDYIHRHEKPYPKVIRKKTSGDSTLKKALKAPTPMVFAFLGYALDLEVEINGKLKNLDWKQERELPFLVADVDRRLLVILPQDGSYPILLHSPILEVTEAGIHN